jgi:hypothetical protein
MCNFSEGRNLAKPELVADCPRCNARKMSFDILAVTERGKNYDWQTVWESFCVCKHCRRSTVFVLKQLEIVRDVSPTKVLLTIDGSVQKFAREEGYINIADMAAVEAPEFLPDDVLGAFNEGAKCMAIGCYNAAGTMFRLCVDHASRGKLPAGVVVGLNYRTRRDLGLRMGWLFDNGLLPEALRDLSTTIREDGNDGAHRGTLSEDDALDIQEFTVALLERIYTEPEKLRLAAERRDARRVGV